VLVWLLPCAKYTYKGDFLDVQVEHLVSHPTRCRVVTMFVAQRLQLVLEFACRKAMA
jgi:hypothetical protein